MVLGARDAASTGFHALRALASLFPRERSFPWLCDHGGTKERKTEATVLITLKKESFFTGS